MMMKVQKEIVRYSDKGHISTEDTIVIEEIIDITINNNLTLKISAIPEFHQELLYGLLLTSGSIKSITDIESLNINGNKITVAVPVSNCSGISIGASGSQLPETGITPVKRDQYSPLPEFDIRPVFKKFRNISELFKETGAVHAAALMLPTGEILFFSEDVGRHNAIDKVIGKALIADCNLSETFLMTSGRVSGEIAKKSAYANFRGILSPSAPTSMAVETAEKYRLTIAGFIRENRYNIYTAKK